MSATLSFLAVSEIDQPSSITTSARPVEPYRSDTAGLDIQVLRGGRSIVESIAAEWDLLCQEGPGNAPFFTATWLRAWLQAFEPDAELVLVVARRNELLRGVLPLIEKRTGYRGRMLTRLKSPTNYHSGRADLVHGTGDGEEVAHAIWNTVNRQLRWDILEYRDVIDESGFHTLARAAADSGHHVIKRETIRSPYLAFDSAEDLSQRGPAKRLRRAQRTIAKNGGYHLRRTAPADLTGLERLVQQEAAGWKGKSGTAIGQEPAALAFYSALVSSRSPSFVAVFNEIIFNNETIAINLGIEMGNRYFDPKRTYDETQHRYCPGHLVTQEILLALPDRGIHEFDMMGHDEAYKLTWSTTTRQHYHYLIFRPGLKGTVLHRGVEMLAPMVMRWRTRLQQSRSKTDRSTVETTSDASTES